MTDENEPQWRIVVEVPERLSFEDRDNLLTAVENAARAWAPADRDWDPWIAASPVEHWELDDERLRREGAIAALQEIADQYPADIFDGTTALAECEAHGITPDGISGRAIRERALAEIRALEAQSDGR